MTPNEFAYWLQGFAELNAEPPTAEQWQSIRDHLALVFHKVTPPLRSSVDLSKWGPPIRIDCTASTLGRSADNAIFIC